MRIATLATLSVDSIVSFKESFLSSFSTGRILAIALIAAVALGALAVALLYFWHKKSQLKGEVKEEDIKVTAAAGPLTEAAPLKKSEGSSEAPVVKEKAEDAKATTTTILMTDKSLFARIELSENLLQVKLGDKDSIQKGIVAFEAFAKKKFEMADLTQIKSLKIEREKMLEMAKKAEILIDKKDAISLKEAEALIDVLSKENLKMVSKKSEVLIEGIEEVKKDLPFTNETDEDIINVSVAFLSYALALVETQESILQYKSVLDKIMAA